MKQGAVAGGEVMEGAVDDGAEEVEVADDWQGEGGWWEAETAAEMWFFEVVYGEEEEGGGDNNKE